MMRDSGEVDLSLLAKEKFVIKRSKGGLDAKLLEMTTVML